MKRFIAVVFDTEMQAYKGIDALRTLQNAGDISIKSAALVAKTDGGAVTIKKSVRLEPLGTFSGILAGATLGLIGAVLAIGNDVSFVASLGTATTLAGSIVVGGMFGGVVSMIQDIVKADVDASVLQNAMHWLEPGKVSIVASVYETRPDNLDAEMAGLGATVFRRGRREETNERLRNGYNEFGDTATKALTAPVDKMAMAAEESEKATPVQSRTWIPRYL